MSRHKTHRDALKAFSDARLEVTLQPGKKHTRIWHNQEIVALLSHGGKQDPRVAADIRRAVRGLVTARDALTLGPISKD